MAYDDSDSDFGTRQLAVQVQPGDAEMVPDAPPSRWRLRSAVPPAVLRGLRVIRSGMLDIVFPPSCLVCRKATAKPNCLCPDCWSRVGFIERPYCDKLGTPFAYDLGVPGLVSPEAIANPPVYRRARAVAKFDDGPVRHLIHRLKYSDRMELARPLGLWMARAGRDLLSEADLLVPVPLHRARLASRQFNQANALAQAISRICGVKTESFALQRVKPTAPQVGLSRNQRALNVQGAFKVPEAERIAIEGRAIVLVDDVLTSGATLNAAARALQRAGAKSVDVLVFARVVTSA